MSAYVIIQGVVTDAERYEQYKALSGPAVLAAGGSFIVRGGATTGLEGEPPPPRTVVLQFDTHEAAVAWYHSDTYRAAHALRDGAADMRIYVVDGA